MREGTSAPAPHPGGEHDERRGSGDAGKPARPGTAPSGPPPPTLRRAPRGPRPLGALRHRNYRLYFVGFVVSLIGVWMQRVAQSWLVLELTDSAFFVGLVEALGFLPVLMFSLYAGALADRTPKRRLVLVTQVASMVFALALAAVVLAGHVTLWHVILLASLLGLANAFDIPARQSFMVEMVGKEDLMSGIALNSSAFNGSRLVGPAIAGLMISLVGLGPVFLVNGVSYLAVIVALLLMRLAPSPMPAAHASTWQTIAEGFRHVRSDRRILLLIVNVGVISLFALPVQVLLPVVVRDVLGGGAVEYGWMMSAVGAGAMVGALAIALIGQQVPKGPWLAASSALLGISVIAFGAARSLEVALGLLLLIGLATMVTAALTNTLLQTLAPDELRGRVISFYTLAFIGLGPFGALQAGALAERFGPTVPLVAGGLVTVIVALLGVWQSRALRELD